MLRSKELGSIQRILDSGRFAADPGILDPKVRCLALIARSKNNLSLVGKFYRVVK